MTPKQATDPVASTGRPRSRRQIAEDFEKFKYLVALIDQSVVEKFVVDVLRLCADTSHEFEQTLVTAVEKTQGLTRQHKKQIQERFRKTLSDPLLKTPHLDKQHISEEVQLVSQTVVRHWINHLYEALRILNPDVRLLLDENLLPMRPQMINENIWQQFGEEMQENLSELLSDFGLTVDQGLEILKQLRGPLYLELEKTPLLLPENLIIYRQEHFIYCATLKRFR